MKRSIRGLLLLAALVSLNGRAAAQDIPSRLDVDAPGMTRNLGKIYPGMTATERITFTNPVDKVIRITDLRLLNGANSFMIISMSPGPLPVELPKNATITIYVAAQPMEPNRSYSDSLRIAFDSREMTVALEVSTTAGTTSVDEPSIATGPAIIRPNPVIGSGIVSFHLDRPGSARLVVSDASGVDVASMERTGLAAGDQSLVWDASALPAGLYYYRLVTGVKVETGSVMVVR